MVTEAELYKQPGASLPPMSGGGEYDFYEFFDASLEGNTTIGDAIGDTFTVNAISNWGTSASPLVLTAGSPTISIYTTNAGTSGSTNAEPFYVKSTLTGIGQVGGRSRFHTYSDVAGGGWVNALKSYMEFGSSGRVTGLASSMCAEILMPNTTLTTGAYAPLEIEYVAGGTSTDTVGSLSGVHAALMYMNNTGDADGDFDDKGFFMCIDGLTAGATHLLSAATQTLKIGIGTTTRYLVMSSTEDSLTLTGAATDGIAITGACTDGIHISGSTTASAIHISGNQVDGILYDVDAAADNGISFAVDNGITLGTGINMVCTGTGTITNAISITYSNSATEAIAMTVATGKTITTGMSFSGAGTWTTGILLDATAIVTGINIGSCTTGINFTGTTYTNGILLGTHDWGVGGTGIELGTTKGLMEIAGKLTSSNDNAGVYMCSYEQLAITSATQNKDISVFVSWNELYITPATTTVLTGSSHYAAVKGHVEASGTITSSTGTTAALWGSLIIPAAYTNNGTIAGCMVDAIIHTSMTNTGDTMAYGIGAHNDPNQGDWEYGLYMPALTVTTGIYIGSCTTGINVTATCTDAISITGTGATASSRAVNINMATPAPNYGDGYAMSEFNLNPTGNGAGHIAALGAWVNLATGTYGADGSFICAQTNGVYEEAAVTLTNARVIFGLRMQAQMGDTEAYALCPFSINNSGMTTTALIYSPNPGVDLGQVTNAGADDGTLIPIMTNGVTKKYVKVYNLA